MKDDRKQITIWYRFDENGALRFLDPCFDEMPIELFDDVMKAFSQVEEEYNKKISEYSSEE